MARIEHWQIKQRQGQPLDIKEQLTANRIKAYYERLNGKVYVSRSYSVLRHSIPAKTFLTQKEKL